VVDNVSVGYLFVGIIGECYCSHKHISSKLGEKPTCGTPGCHAGLISIVAKDLPELQEIYENHIYFSEGCGNERDYHYSIWADIKPA
jgi:hypothetical protein